MSRPFLLLGSLITRSRSPLMAASRSNRCAVTPLHRRRSTRGRNASCSTRTRSRSPSPKLRLVCQFTPHPPAAGVSRGRPLRLPALPSARLPAGGLPLPRVSPGFVRMPCRLDTLPDWCHSRHCPSAPVPQLLRDSKACLPLSADVRPPLSAACPPPAALRLPSERCAG